MVVDLLPGADVETAFQRLDKTRPASVQDESVPERPAPVDNPAQFGRLPFILAGLLGLIALLASIYVLASALLRRRRDLSVLGA